MKSYYSKKTKEWYNEGNTMTRRLDENTVFSGIPSSEQLSNWGFVEWVEPAPTPEQLLAQAKSNKIAELEAYDQSDAVNSFKVNVGGQVIEAWLTPDQRANYKNSLDSAELLGLTEVHPVFGGQQLTIPTQTAKEYLAKIQIYADRCYIITETHRAAINALSTIEEVEAYDYQQGYPEKLVFDLR
jgi:hypothetical protein